MICGNIKHMEQWRQSVIVCMTCMYVVRNSYMELLCM